MTYIVYATLDNGEGRVYKIGEYEDLEDIKINTSLFMDDIEITIHEQAEGEEPKIIGEPLPFWQQKPPKGG